MNLNFIKKSFLLFALSLAIISCDEEDRTGDSQLMNSNPTVAINLDFANPVIFKEADGDMTYNYTVTLSETNIVDTQLYISQTGGTATEHDDYDMTHSITIPAGYTSGSGSITVYGDLDVEGDELLEITIGDNRTANSSMTPLTVNVNIVDYVFCNWVLEATDTYGDGWNGASVSVTSEGTTTHYANEDLDGVAGAETQSIMIPVTDGADYSFEFNSGDWDSEIVFTLTSPDGTVFSDGPSPTVGVITSGTNDCP